MNFDDPFSEIRKRIKTFNIQLWLSGEWQALTWHFDFSKYFGAMPICGFEGQVVITDLPNKEIYFNGDEKIKGLRTSVYGYYRASQIPFEWETNGDWVESFPRYPNGMRNSLDLVMINKSYDDIPGYIEYLGR